MWKMDRIMGKILLGDEFPSNLIFSTSIKTKSGKTRHEFPSDYRYLSDLDLATFSETELKSLDIDVIKAIYHAKNGSWKKKDEKNIFKLIESICAEHLIDGEL